jgi:hypothetical protein
MTLKVGRNDPCPCGSGEKHKKCCLHGSPPRTPLELERTEGLRGYPACNGVFKGYLDEPFQVHDYWFFYSTGFNEYFEITGRSVAQTVALLSEVWTIVGEIGALRSQPKNILINWSDDAMAKIDQQSLRERPDYRGAPALQYGIRPITIPTSEFELFEGPECVVEQFILFSPTRLRRICKTLPVELHPHKYFNLLAHECAHAFGLGPNSEFTKDLLWNTIEVLTECASFRAVHKIEHTPRLAEVYRSLRGFAQTQFGKADNSSIMDYADMFIRAVRKGSVGLL